VPERTNGTVLKTVGRREAARGFESHPRRSCAQSCVLRRWTDGSSQSTEVTSPPRKWKDCWLLVPSGVTAPGDSGAAAFDLNKEVVGILAGGSRSTRKSRAPSFQYLQDMESLEQGFLTPNNVTLA
jgi:hypothetical protein